MTTNTEQLEELYQEREKQQAIDVPGLLHRIVS
jgi:hypothetical protein